MALGRMDKLTRVLWFLVGSRDAGISALLTRRGYSADVRKEGWRLLTAAGGGHQDSPMPPVPQGDPEGVAAVRKLDAWENEWFPVVTASLQRHHPKLQEMLFQNLSQSEGRQVIVTVGAFLERLDRLKESPEGEAALALLASRGFTPEVRAIAADLLELIKEPSTARITDADRADADAAEQE